MRGVLLLLCCLPIVAFSQQSSPDENLQSRKEKVHHEMDSLLHGYLDDDPNDQRTFRLIVPEWIIESMTTYKNKFDTQTQYTKEDIAKAEYTVGSFYKRENNKKPALKWFMKAVELGQKDAMFQIGLNYEKGSLNQQKEMTQAIKWYTKAAQLGNDEAMFNLGSIYYDGRGVKNLPTKALRYFKSAADAGNVEAIVKLGNVYDEGTIVKRNIRKAIAYWQNAAEKGEYQCYAFIGKKYLEGDGVEQDEKKALAYFKQGDKLKNLNCTLQLALCYYNGQGVETDYFRAYLMLSDIFPRLNSNICLFYLGECLRLGRGVEVDYKRAALHYCLAIRTNSNYAPPHQELQKLLNEGKINQSDIEGF